jgi:RNA polymerase sigma-70 factor (ECF subfamily)
MNDSLQPGPREFVTTRWGVVLEATGKTPGAGEAMEALCRDYWYPLYAFVRRQGHAPHDAQDLTQEFFARLIEKNWLGGVAPGRGRFRTWLLASMKHFLCNEWDRRHAEKRGSGAIPLPIDGEIAESRYLREPAAEGDAGRLFDRRWALTVLDRVMTRLRDEFASVGKLALFEAIKGTLTGDAQRYGDIARSLETTEGAVKVAVHRLRERYRTVARAEVAETVGGVDEVEAEWRHLLAVLSE